MHEAELEGFLFDLILNSSILAKANSCLRDQYHMPKGKDLSVLLKIKVTKQPTSHLYPSEVELHANELETMQTGIFEYSAVFTRKFPFLTDLRATRPEDFWCRRSFSNVNTFLVGF